MELKSDYGVASAPPSIGSNRTFMELKYFTDAFDTLYLGWF